MRRLGMSGKKRGRGLWGRWRGRFDGLVSHYVALEGGNGLRRRGEKKEKESIDGDLRATIVEKDGMKRIKSYTLEVGNPRERFNFEYTAVEPSETWPDSI
jgi:hypothetical protein